MKLDNSKKMGLGEIRALVDLLANQQIDLYASMITCYDSRFEDYFVMCVNGCEILLKEYKKAKYPRTGYRDTETFIAWTCKTMYDIVNNPDNFAGLGKGFHRAASAADLLYMQISAFLDDIV